MKCSACEQDLQPQDRFCSHCGMPVLKLVGAIPPKTKSTPSSEPSEGSRGEVGPIEGDFVSEASALGVAIADRLMPDSPMARMAGAVLGKDVAQMLQRSSFISFGSDKASVALAEARLKEDAKNKHKSRAKKKKKSPKKRGA